MKILKLNNLEPLSIEGIENLHVESVEVMTCDDSDNPTDRVIINGTVDTDEENPLSGTDAILKVTTGPPMKPELRYRYEPAVTMILKEENGHRRFRLNVGHHKGSILVTAKEVLF
jgi:hypothetical protein